MMRKNSAAILLLSGLVLIGPLSPVLAGDGAVTSTAGTQTKTKKEFKRPAYNPVLRWKEDWSALRGLDRDRTGDPFDPVKFIPLNQDGSIYLSIGGGVRARVEHFSNFNFSPLLDDGYLQYHFLLHGDLHLTEIVRVFVEGIDAEGTFRNLPGNQRTTDINAFDLNQGFLDINIPIDGAKLTLRGGRQAFAFGKQRLVSPLPWGNAYRHWDGFTAILDIKGWNAQGFWTEFSPVDKYEADVPDGQTKFWGFYATHGKPTDLLALDAYFLGLNREDPVTFNGTVGPEDRYTIGGRALGVLQNFDYEIESAYQFGQVGAGDVSAWMIATEGGYTFKACPLQPRFWLGFDYASGDSATGGDVGTFNQLFPLGHAYFGYMDFVGRQNIIDIHPGASIKCASDKMTVKAEGHFFWLADSADALYNAGGGVVRRGMPGASDQVGSEVDFVANYKFNRHLDIEAGYCHFFPGDFISQTGPSDQSDFVYFQTQIYF
jgi:hypothetical protein